MRKFSNLISLRNVERVVEGERRRSKERKEAKPKAVSRRIKGKISARSHQVWKVKKRVIQILAKLVIDKLFGSNVWVSRVFLQKLVETLKNGKGAIVVKAIWFKEGFFRKSMLGKRSFIDFKKGYRRYSLSSGGSPGVLCGEKEMR